MKISLKSTKPFVEKRVKAKELAESILVGIKIYSEKELDGIREEFLLLSNGSKLERLNKQLHAVSTSLNLSESQIEEQVVELQSQIKLLTQEQKDKILEFYKKQVLYIKGAKLNFEQADGTDVEINIPDTREVKPIESLWTTSEECLYALLDLYLDSPVYKDSLKTTIMNTVFETNLFAEQSKNY